MKLLIVRVAIYLNRNVHDIIQINNTRYQNTGNVLRLLGYVNCSCGKFLGWFAFRVRELRCSNNTIFFFEGNIFSFLFGLYCCVLECVECEGAAEKESWKLDRDVVVMCMEWKIKKKQTSLFSSTWKHSSMCTTMRELKPKSHKTVRAHTGELNHFLGVPANRDD